MERQGIFVFEGEGVLVHVEVAKGYRNDFHCGNVGKISYADSF